MKIREELISCFEKFDGRSFVHEKECHDFMNGLLSFAWTSRLSPDQALTHPFLNDQKDLFHN